VFTKNQPEQLTPQVSFRLQIRAQAVVVRTRGFYMTIEAVCIGELPGFADSFRVLHGEFGQLLAHGETRKTGMSHRTRFHSPQKIPAFERACIGLYETSGNKKAPIYGAFRAVSRTLWNVLKPIFGGASGIRTPDLWIMIPSL
jgi:hypothetical protein